MRQALRALFAVVVIVVTASALPAAAGASRAPRLEPCIRLTTPRSYQVVQRDERGHGVITVHGRSIANPGALLVRWGDEPWVRVLPRRSGEFSLRLHVGRTGQETLVVCGGEHKLSVRRRLVGVGDVYVVAGQSNASGRSQVMSVCENEAFQAGLFGNDDRWRRLTDPVDSPDGQIDTVSRDWRAGGSVWPLVAEALMEAEGVPVAIVPCARGNVTMENWLRDPERPRSSHTLFGSMVRRIRAAGGRVRAVLLWQGESDARWSVPPASFERRLRAFGCQVRAAVGAPVVVGQIGDFSPTRYPPDSVDAVRMAQQRACDASPNLILGPSLYDIDLEGSWHVHEADDIVAAAHRWTAAILGGVLGRPVGTAPRLLSATEAGAGKVMLRFAVADEPLLDGAVGGITVEAAGETIEVVAATVTGATTVELTLARPVAGPITVSLGEGRSGAGARVPTESSSWRLPALAFVAAPASAASALVAVPAALSTPAHRASRR